MDVRTVRAARELIGFLTRTIKTLRLYHQDNPVYVKALTDIGARFSGFVDDHGALELTLDQSRILLEDELLHQDEDPKDGLAFRLYADGVRLLTFSEGLEDEEARTTVLLMIQATSMSLADDDFVTLMWNADLPHVKVVAVEDDMVGGELTPTRGGLGEPKLEQASHAAQQPEPGAQPQRVSYGADVLGAFRLTERDLGYMEQLVRREQSVNPVEDLGVILKSILQIEKDEAEFTGTVTLYGGLIRDFLLQGRPAHAAVLAQGLADVAEDRFDLTPAMLGAMNGVLNGLGSAPMLDALRTALMPPAEPEGGAETGAEPPRRIDPADLGAYLTQLRSADLQHLLGFGARVPDTQMRELICEHAARLCPDKGDEVARMLLDRDDALIQCALSVLGRVGTPADLPHFVSVSKHRDVNVRRTALEAICRISGGAHNQMLPYLTDPDPRVRRRAQGLVEQYRFTGAIEPLKDLAASDSFAAWDLNERRAVFGTIGALGGEDEVAYFKRFTGQKKGWLFGGKRDEDPTLCAISGLRATSAESARKLLEELAQDKNQRIRSAAELALREFGKGS